MHTYAKAIRYVLHDGVFEDYSVGAVHEFDREAMLKDFNSIRRTLTLVR